MDKNQNAQNFISDEQNTLGNIVNAGEDLDIFSENRIFDNKYMTEQDHTAFMLKMKAENDEKLLKEKELLKKYEFQIYNKNQELFKKMKNTQDIQDQTIKNRLTEYKLKRLKRNERRSYQSSSPYLTRNVEPPRFITQQIEKLQNEKQVNQSKVLENIKDQHKPISLSELRNRSKSVEKIRQENDLRRKISKQKMIEDAQQRCQTLPSKSPVQLEAMKTERRQFKEKFDKITKLMEHRSAYSKHIRSSSQTNNTFRSTIQPISKHIPKQALPHSDKVKIGNSYQKEANEKAKSFYLRTSDGLSDRLDLETPLKRIEEQTQHSDNYFIRKAVSTNQKAKKEYVFNNKLETYKTEKVQHKNYLPEIRKSLSLTKKSRSSLVFSALANSQNQKIDDHDIIKYIDSINRTEDLDIQVIKNKERIANNDYVKSELYSEEANVYIKSIKNKLALYENITQHSQFS